MFGRREPSGEEIARRLTSCTLNAAAEHGKDVETG